MKKLKLFITTMLVLLFIGGLSLNALAQNIIIPNGKYNAEKSLNIIKMMKLCHFKSIKSYSMSIFADTTYVGAVQVQISFTATTSGATFINANDSVSVFFEMWKNGLPDGSYYVHFTHGAGDSLIVATIWLSVTSGAYYEIIPHSILYESGNPVCFADGSVLAFTTDCSASTTSVTSNPTGTVCAGTDVTLTASGATSYAWSTGETSASIIVTPLVTTTYTVTGTTGGCTAVGSKTVTVSGTFSPTMGPDTAICIGGSVTLNAGGGTTYLWSPSTGLSATNIANPVCSTTSTRTYSCLISNGTCSTSLQVTVTVGAAISVNVTSSDATICAGDLVIITASSSTGTSYVWNTGQTTAIITVNPLITTTYTVTVSNGTCSKTDDFTVTVEPLAIILSVTDGSIFILEGTGFTNLSNMKIYPAGYTYYPYFKNDTVAKFINVVLECDDDIVLTTTGSCQSSFLYTCVGVNEEKGEDAICIKQNEQINLFDMTGRLIQKINSPKDFTKKEIYLVKDLFINDLPPGCYFWNSTETTQKFVQ